VLIGEYDGSNFPADIDSYSNVSGSKPDLVEWFQSFDEPLYWPNQQAGIDARGVTPVITWSPDSDFSMSSLLAGGYDSYLTTQARSARAWARPIMIRLFHEMNGNWTSYGFGSTTPAQFIAGWRHVVNIFRQAGATNVSWVWCPNIYGFGQVTPFDAYYPGDAYVDWTGLDGYNYTNAWRSFSDLFGASYADITRLTGKPLMVAEWGSTESGGSKAAWITAAFSQLATAMPRIRAMVAFSAVADDDFRVNSSSTSLAAYRSAVAAFGS
jgi:beta-mannanase